MSFQTKYETRTRLVDESGNEVSIIVDGESPPSAQPMADGRISEGVAPPHPDVEGADPQTASEDGVDTMDIDAAMHSLAASPTPLNTDASADVAKEQVVEDVVPVSAGEAQPANEMDEPRETA